MTSTEPSGPEPAPADPRPEPPPPADFDACCGNGCDPCILDLHDLAMDAYRQALREWLARHPEARDQPPSARQSSQDGSPT